MLQIPMPMVWRKEAEKEAYRQGFSSLQEMVRIILRKIAARTLHMHIEEAVQLSTRAEKRYLKMQEDVRSGKVALYEAKDVNDLMDQLHGRKNPVLAKIS